MDDIAQIITNNKARTTVQFCIITLWQYKLNCLIYLIIFGHPNIMQY